MNSKKTRFLTTNLCALLVAFTGLLPSTAVGDPSALPRRPRVAVVLEGGGAKGFAHVGVLKVLEEMHVPVDFIVGTSMGSIVGAAYASGRSIDEMTQVLSTTDWDALFNEAPPRRLVQYRRKAGIEREIFGDKKIGIQNGEIVTPLAVVQGQNIEPMLQRLFGKVPASVSFDALPVPFRAVAANIETGEAVILKNGSLATAARASMSVPGFFTPVEIDGKILVDGGITDNLPIDVALAEMPDVIIAIECKDHLRTREKLAGPLAISGQILDLLLERNTQNALKLLRPQDIHIELELGEFGSTSFQNASQIMALGETKARDFAAKFEKLAVPQSEYRIYAEKRISGGEYNPTLAFVRVDGVKGIQQTEIEKSLSTNISQPLDRKKIEKQISEFTETGDFQKISYDIEEKNGQTGLLVHVEPKTWLKNFLRFGFSLEDNFSGDNSYSLALETRLNDLNAAGGYADFQLEAGKFPRVFAELYQPIVEGSRFFIAPEVSLTRQDVPVREGDEVIAVFHRDEETLALKGGYSLGKYGEFSSGWRWGRGQIDRHIGDPALKTFDYNIGEAFGRMVIDQLDSPDFPTEGYRVGVTGIAGREGLGSDSDFEKTTAYGAVPFTFGQTTLLLNAEGGFAPADLPVQRYSVLGGFFDISGFEQASLAASNYWVYRSVLFYRVTAGGSALFPFGGYLGATSELSSLRSDIDRIPDRAHIISGSVFVGLDTPVLPVYLGYGQSDESSRSVYLTVGRIAGRRR